MRQFLASVAGKVLQHGIVLQHAGEYFEERNAAGKRVADGLENVSGNRLGVAHLANCRLAIIRRRRSFHLAALDRRRHVIDDEVQHLVGSHVAQARSEQHGEDLVFANGVVHAADDVLGVDGALFEKLFHQRVVAFGNRFNQLFVRRLRLGLHVVGNGPNLGLAVAAHIVGVGLHLHQIDHAGEALLRADRKLHRNDAATEAVGQRFHYPREVGTLAIHASADDGARQRKPVGVIPYALGNDFDSADRVDHDQGRVDRRKHHLGFMDEHVEAGGVDEVDLRLAPLHDGGCRRQRHGARDFFFVVVGDSGTFIHAAEPLGGAGGVQHGGYKRGFARMRVPNQGDIADVCAFVSLHVRLLGIVRNLRRLGGVPLQPYK